MRSIRVKDVLEGEREEGIAVNVKENPDKKKEKKKLNVIAFSEMWENAFLKKGARSAPESAKPARQKAPAPYIYLRAAFMVIALFIILLSAFYLFNGYEMYPILIAVAVVAVPVIFAIFFAEMDTSGRVSFGNMLFAIFLSGLAALAIEFVYIRYIYKYNGAVISDFGALAIGLMQCVAGYSIGALLIRQFKINDAVSGMLVGALIGCGFALVNSATVCVREVFIETQYAPSLKILAYNEVMVSSFNNMYKTFLLECILHAAAFVLINAAFGGMFTSARKNGFRGSLSPSILIIYLPASWLFSALWFLPLPGIPELFAYLFRIMIVAILFTVCVRTMREGLSQNVYE